jgi:hypothetical protein
MPLKANSTVALTGFPDSEFVPLTETGNSAADAELGADD